MRTPARARDLAGVHVDDRQETVCSVRVIREAVVHEVKAPDLVGGRHDRARLPHVRALPALVRFFAQAQPFDAVQPCHALDVYGPTLSSQQHVHPAISVTYACRSDLFDSSQKREIQRRELSPIADARATEARRDASAAFADPIAFAKVADQHATCGRLYHFFESTS